mmetsp:Transcript_20534/g.17934  ORF Transcript_20534/g.17934 Transcript_20534/m.17934 type:complete len:83 (+) Transcript_20534:273-521(+)
MPIMISEVALESSFAKIRTSCQNLPSFLMDVICAMMEGDVALINSGTFRSDCLFKEGPFLRGDLHRVLPYTDNIVKMEITGE